MLTLFHWILVFLFHTLDPTFQLNIIKSLNLRSWTLKCSKNLRICLSGVVLRDCLKRVQSIFNPSTGLGLQVSWYMYPCASMSNIKVNAYKKCRKTKGYIFYSYAILHTHTCDTPVILGRKSSIMNMVYKKLFEHNTSRQLRL